MHLSNKLSNLTVTTNVLFYNAHLPLPEMLKLVNHDGYYYVEAQKSDNYEEGEVKHCSKGHRRKPWFCSIHT